MKGRAAELVTRLKLWARKHGRKTVAFLKAHPAWLWKTRFFCLAILGTAGVPIVVLAWWPQKEVIRYAGLGLQLAGIGTV